MSVALSVDLHAYGSVLVSCMSWSMLSRPKPLCEFVCPL